MKKLQIVFATVCWCGFFVSMAAAHQDQSFTNRATAGMFDDMYDLFKYSPAYLPSFERNALWSQISNLQDQSDQLISSSGSPMYFLGAQNDLMGMGRIGVAVDFYLDSYAVSSMNYGSTSSHYGFGETTWEQYLDTNGDEIIDFRRETYGRGEATDNYSMGDIYVAYGLGGFMDLDVGVGVRGIWYAYNPTYTDDHPYYSPSASDPTFSFDRLGRMREYDLLTGQELYRLDETGTGSWSLNYSAWRLILSARSQGVMGMLPDFDVVLNVAPILYGIGNAYETEWQMIEDNAPSNPSVLQENSRVVTEEGCNPIMSSFPLFSSVDDKPAAGFGVDTDLRLDTDMVPGVHLTGWLGFDNLAWTYQDAKRSIDAQMNMRDTNWVGGMPVYETGTSSENYHYDWDGKGGNTGISARVRAQIPFQNVRLGFGLGGSISNYNYEETAIYDISVRNRLFIDDSDPSNDYTGVASAHEKHKKTYDETSSTLELPVGIIIDVLKNFAVQLGARYQVTRQVVNQSFDIVEANVPDMVTTYDDGYVISDVPSNWNNVFTQLGYSTDAMNSFSRVDVDHDTDFYYGLSWWPFEMVQVEMYGFTYVTEPWRYYISVNIYH